MGMTTRIVIDFLGYPGIHRGMCSLVELAELADFRDPLNPLDMEHAQGMWQLNMVYVFFFFLNGPWVNPRSKQNSH